MTNYLQKVIFQNHVSEYLIATAIIAGSLIFVTLFKKFLVIRFKRLAEKTATKLDDFVIKIINRSLIPVLYFMSFYLGIRTLNIHPLIERVVNIIGVLILTFFGIRLLVNILDLILEKIWLKKEKEESRVRAIRGMINIVKGLVWIIGFIFLLDNIGFHVTSVITGLGIGGIAVALAAQAILGDLFSYFSIFFDKPFQIGDFIIIGDLMGGVENIGIKTTRIRSLTGEQLVFSNSDLTNSRIRNYKRMKKRRVLFKIGVTYQTPYTLLVEIPDIIKNIVTGIEHTSFDRAHFQAYGDFSLTFEVVYFVMSSDYNKYMDIQQEINLKLHQEFENRKIEFAYPTQTVFLSKGTD